MPENSASWNSSPKQKLFIPIVVALALIAIIFAVANFFRSAVAPVHVAAAPLPPAQPPALNGWRVDVSSEGLPKLGQRFGGRFSPGQVCFVPAGSKFSVRAEPSGAAGMLVEESAEGSWDHEGGELNPAHGESSQQECRAPMQPGLYRLTWRPADAQVARLTDTRGPEPRSFIDVVILTRAEVKVQGDRTHVKVNGTSIGSFLDPTQSPVRRVRENAQQYRVPEFFAMLTPQTMNLKVGPDFDLSQLIAYKDYHGPDGKKVYTTIRHTDVIPLRADLIDKLIKLRERLRSKGVKVTKFWITSGFRTPDYNKSIGGASYSRHCYGDAVDLCIDEDDDKKMDDLNGDGRIDRKDGLVIANACRELELEGAVVPGGIGVYEWQSDDSVGSHVHIDCRGYISRWGQIGSGRTKKSFLWWPKAEFQEDENGE